MPDIFVIGLNHKTAPVALRERLAFAPASLPGMLAQLRAVAQLEECLVLSTCNRVEIYGAVPALNGSVARVQEFLRRHSGVDGLEPHLYVLQQPQSIEHLFAVASGLESMVLGEGEILGQVKQAYETARAAGTTGRTFNVLFQKALNAAKEVRTLTGIGRGSLSVGSTAVALARKIFGDLSRHQVLMVGAGKMSRQVLASLTAQGARELLIANRTVERARELTASCNGTALSLDALAWGLQRADIVISSTAAPQPVVTSELVRRVMGLRHQRPLFMIDIAVPRDVEPSAGHLPNVFLYDIDDLAGVMRASLASRTREVDAGRAIVTRKSRLFLEWLESRDNAAPGNQSEPLGARADSDRSAMA